MDIHFLNLDFQIWTIPKIQSKFSIRIFSWVRPNLAVFSRVGFDRNLAKSTISQIWSFSAKLVPDKILPFRLSWSWPKFGCIQLNRLWPKLDRIQSSCPWPKFGRVDLSPNLAVFDRVKPRQNCAVFSWVDWDWNFVVFSQGGRTKFVHIQPDRPLSMNLIESTPIKFWLSRPWPKCDYFLPSQLWPKFGRIRRNQPWPKFSWIQSSWFRPKFFEIGPDPKLVAFDQVIPNWNSVVCGQIISSRSWSKFIHTRPQPKVDRIRQSWPWPKFGWVVHDHNHDRKSTEFVPCWNWA